MTSTPSSTVDSKRYTINNVLVRNFGELILSQSYQSNPALKKALLFAKDWMVSSDIYGYMIVLDPSGTNNSNSHSRVDRDFLLGAGLLFGQTAEVLSQLDKKGPNHGEIYADDDGILRKVPWVMCADDTFDLRAGLFLQFLGKRQEG